MRNVLPWKKREVTQMPYQSEIKKVPMEEFFGAVTEMKTGGWRLVQICAASTEDGYEMSYSFCKDYDMVTLRLEMGRDEEVSSITQIYPCAFIMENEAAELFGVKITDIQLDYKDKLYRIDVETPFKDKE